MKAKRVPLRKCIACGENKDRKDLIRVVKDKDNNVLVDKNNKLNGRGAYICINEDCFEVVEKNNKLSKSLRTEVPTTIYKDLKEELLKKSEK